MAKAWLDTPEDERPPAVERQHEWSPERTTLASIHDRLAELVAVTVNVNSKNGGSKPHYTQRPEAAIQRLTEEQDVEQVQASMGHWMDD